MAEHSLQPDSRPHRKRRWVLIGGLVALLALACAAVILVPRLAASATPSATNKPATTVALSLKDLQRIFKVTGQLGYGDATQLTSKLAGTITWLPDIGAVIEPGQPLYKLDGSRPIVLMQGTVPSWRALNETSTAGVDISQLEQNLVDLGFDPNKTIAVDNKWSTTTTAAVKRWQKQLGVDQTGSIEQGMVVFLPGSVRISKALLRVGADAGGGAILEVTGTKPSVNISLDASKQTSLVVGTKATITLPDETTTTGSVASVGTVAVGGGTDESGAAKTATVPVVVTLDDPSKAKYDGATVGVAVVVEEHKQVLAVPVTALLALASGGYGLEIKTEDGSRIVSVTTGLFADGYVEVTGAIKAGDKVVVPS